MAFPRASWNVHGEQSTGALHESRWPYTHCWSCILNLLTTPLFSVFPVPLSTHFSALFSLDFWDHKKQIVPMCPFLLSLGWRWNTWVALFSKGVLGWPSRCHPCLGDLHQCRGEQLLFTAEPGSCWTPFRCLCAWSILPSLLLEHDLET